MTIETTAFVGKDMTCIRRRIGGENRDGAYNVVHSTIKLISRNFATC